MGIGREKKRNVIHVPVPEMPVLMTINSISHAIMEMSTIRTAMETGKQRRKNATVALVPVMHAWMTINIQPPATVAIPIG